MPLNDGDLFLVNQGGESKKITYANLKSNILEDRTADSPLAGFRNLIINGAMTVAQRGTTSTVNTYGTVDRWASVFGGGAVTQSQQTLTNADGEVWDQGFRNFFRMTNTTAATGIGDNRRLTHIVEAQNIAGSGWDYENSASNITLSFWVRSSVSQQYFGSVITWDGTAQTFPFNIQQENGDPIAANTWTKITQVIPGNANLQIDNDNGIGFQLDIVPFFGANFTNPGRAMNTWEPLGNGDERFPDMTNTWASTAGATFDVTGVQLELGPVATPFEHRSFGTELALCQRYYYKLPDEGNSEGFILNTVSFDTSGGGLRRANYMLPVEMRVDPTVENITMTDAAAGFIAMRQRKQFITIAASPDGGNSNAQLSCKGFTADAEL